LAKSNAGNIVELSAGATFQLRLSSPIWWSVCSRASVDQSAARQSLVPPFVETAIDFDMPNHADNFVAIADALPSAPARSRRSATAVCRVPAAGV
jgi:hypothetical protein